GRRIRDLARRARERELSPDDVRGGTFTITNPGQFGAIAATPIINQPQVAILDLEAIVKRAVVITDEDGNDSIAIRAMTMLCMSWDHRATGGVDRVELSERVDVARRTLEVEDAPAAAVPAREPSALAERVQDPVGLGVELREDEGLRHPR